MSSNWGGSCTYSGSTDKSNGDWTANTSCPIYTSTNNITVSVEAYVTHTSDNQTQDSAGISVRMPFS